MMTAEIEENFKDEIEENFKDITLSNYSCPLPLK
jgi:hypothetical protein